METKSGRLKPGEIAHLVLSAVNSGSSMAKDVQVSSLLPEQIDIVASEPVASERQKGEHIWKFPELGPGERRSIVLSYRVKSGCGGRNKPSNRKPDQIQGSAGQFLLIRNGAGLVALLVFSLM